MNSSPSFYSGTSNVVVPIKQSQYPPEAKGASRLQYYAMLHSSVEINATFYKVPKRATIEKWGESVPHNFKFTFKVPKAVTHAKDLQFSGADLETFVAAVGGVGHKKGCLLVQLPPSIKQDMQEEVEGILEGLSSDAKGWHIAVEFRHTSWYKSAVYRMLQHYGAGMVEHDLPKAPTPQVTVADDVKYLRFHGPEGTYRGSYDEPFLAGHANRIAAWVKEGKEVYVYFNNTLGAALGNVATLDACVQQQLR
jgi:uncharacterized protein YecE (DUF72 family)